MTISKRCRVCDQPDKRKLIELGWNAKMSAVALANAIGGDIGGATILKHLKEHAEDAATRNVPVLSISTRERVLAIQELQINEFERRLQMAQERAAAMNAEHVGEDGWEDKDSSDFFDILDKNMQAAVNSILKTQSISDKREKAQGDLKLGLFDAMARAGLAPKSISGGKVPLLETGDDDASGD